MSSPPWFRFYSETLTDRKIDRICRASQQPKVVVIGAWTTLMALANGSPVRGVLLLTEEIAYTLGDIADELGLDEDATMRLLDQFGKFRMIHSDGTGILYLTNWDKRQFSSDSSTERVRKFRERQRQQGDDETPNDETGNNDETLQTSYGNAPDQNRSDQIRVQPSAGEFDDNWLSESRITPRDDPALPIASIPTDPLDHAIQAAHSSAVNWAVPPDAGGHDDYADAPLTAFCRLVGFSPDSLPAKKRNGWAKALRGVGEEWGVGPPVVAACIERIPDSEYHWKTYSAPYQDSFQTDLGTLIGQHLTEQQHGPPQKIVELKLR